MNMPKSEKIYTERYKFSVRGKKLFIVDAPLEVRMLLQALISLKVRRSVMSEPLFLESVDLYHPWFLNWQHVLINLNSKCNGSHYWLWLIITKRLLLLLVFRIIRSVCQWTTVYPPVWHFCGVSPAVAQTLPGSTWSQTYQTKPSFFMFLNWFEGKWKQDIYLHQCLSHLKLSCFEL